VWAVNLGPGCRVGAFAVIHGGTVLGGGARIEEHAIVGKPEGVCGRARLRALPTALGAAAAICDDVAAHLRARQAGGLIAGLRDNAAITLGRSYAQINAAFLAALTAQRLSETGDDAAGACATQSFGHQGCADDPRAV
jgi:hypothetical protein